MDTKPSAPMDAPPPYPGPPSSQSGPPPPGFYAPQPQQIPHPQGPANVTVVQVAPMTLGSHPLNLTCPSCGAQVVTGTKTSPGLLTFLMCGLCMFFGCWFGCCLIPFCVPECQDVEHQCPNCKAHLGVFRRL